MLKKIIKIIALITVFLLPIQFALSNELILPKKKPTLSDEIIKEKIIKSEIFPLKKPSQNDVVQITKKDEVKKQKVTKIIDGEIIPKNKPLVVNTAKAKKAKKTPKELWVDQKCPSTATLPILQQMNIAEAKKNI